MMVCHRSVSLVTTSALLAVTLASASAAPDQAAAQGASQARPSAAASSSRDAAGAAAIATLKFREIGPAVMGGRVDDVAVVESNPSIVYVGTASGGVWKTINAGTTWTPVFDNEAVSTIGDITVAPSDPSIVWVGTGEPNNRQSSSWGNGVYKSTDGGQTWRHQGLAETHHIGRIVIHPTNPDVVYVAALGRLWGANKERGVFKTTDGGQTWKHVLFINQDTGVVDVAMDPVSPETVYAAAYQRRRTVFGFVGSGPDGGLYKTTDGGASWKKVTPQPEASPEKADRQEIGRIGVAVYRRDPRIVYALVEHANGGIFRSEDRGETWVRMSDTNPRPMYYSKVHVDPTNDQRIWVLGAQMFYSEDGGKTFMSNLVQRIHGDYHAMWINPTNASHMIVGSDGGVHWSHDRGRTWDFVNTIAIGQFYEIGLDMREPYYVCGGLQDNNTWCGPSASMDPRGIANSEWFAVGGGDGFYAQVDPNDPMTVYAESQDGNVLRRNLSTGESRSIRPQPAEGDAPYRFQWNSPIVISAFDSRTIYYGGNFVFKSTDRGDSWTRISPDLTTLVDRNTLAILGRVPDRQTRSRHDGVRHYPAITTLAESPLSAQVVWAGTDDGNLQVTRDGGASWRNVVGSVPGLPKGTYVSRVVASRHAEGRAYATFDGHRSDDFSIYAYVTDDYGATWRKITAGIPDDKGVLNVIREHPRNPDLLFAGGEYGAYVSFDRGAGWTRLRLNLPTVPVDDIAVHPRDNDLVLATHGRSIWILDDIAPLAELTDAVLAADLHLFTIRPAIQWRTRSPGGSTGHKMFFGENPPGGIIVNYHLGAKPAEGQGVKIVIADGAGKTVRELDGTSDIGVNRVVWDMRMASPIPPAPGGRGAGGGAGGGFFGGAVGPRVDPGAYTVTVSAGSASARGTAVVRDDPRVTMTDADRAARWAVLNQLMPKAGPLVTAQRTITELRTTVASRLEAWKRPGPGRPPENVQKAGEALLQKIDAIYASFATPPSEALGLGDAGPPLVERPTPYPNRMLMLYGQVANYSGPPTAWQREEATLLAAKADELVAAVQGLVQTDLAALNRLMNESGVPHISPPVIGGGRPRR